MAFLNLQPFGFNELQSISSIRRDSLRDRLDSLIDRKIVTKYRHHSITNKYPTIDSEYYKVIGGTYYSLNSDNSEVKRLLDIYYNDKEEKPPITEQLKKKILTSLDKFSKDKENENDAIMKQITFVRKEIEPFINIDKPHDSIKPWLECIALFRRNRQLMDKTLKIFMIKLRVKLHYVDMVKSTM